MTFEKFLNFFKSPYFHIGKMLILCFFGATLTTLFPFHDLSLGYVFRWKMAAIWGVSFVMAAVCIAIVSLTWYWFHQPNHDMEDNVWSVARYALYGGALPIILVITEISLVQGVDMLFQHNMQYHLWFYAALIFVLNMYYRSVRLKLRLNDMKLDVAALQEENTDQQSELHIKEEQTTELMASLREKEDELEVWQNENTELRRKAADYEKLYIIEIGNEKKAFLKSEIGGFLISGATRVEGGRSIIEMYLLSGESYIDDSESLKGINLIFPEFRLVTRQLLISPESITGYIEQGGVVALHLKFLEEPYIIPGYSWRSQKDWIKEIVDDEKAS